MTRIDVYYTGTQTVDYSIEFSEAEDGCIVSCSQYGYTKETFPSETPEEFISDYGSDVGVTPEMKEGSDYQIVSFN